MERNSRYRAANDCWGRLAAGLRKRSALPIYIISYINTLHNDTTIRLTNQNKYHDRYGSPRIKVDGGDHKIVIFPPPAREAFPGPNPRGREETN
jgi:hypothetical protein